jgi:uncharacterized protein
MQTLNPETLAAAEQGDSEAIYELGVYFATSEGPDRDTLKSIEYFEKAAEQNHPKALCNLGFFYSNGQGVAVNLIKGAAYFRRAAELGFPQAMTNLAICYERGLGLPIDNQAAIKWHTMAADKGVATSQYNLGRLHYTAQPPDHDRAVHFFKLAAAQNQRDALYSLGLCYNLGHGLDKDPAMAIFHYKVAADMDHPSALHNLALHYYYGEGGLEKDWAEARRLFQKAAELGNDSSRQALESMDGVPSYGQRTIDL